MFKKLSISSRLLFASSIFFLSIVSKEAFPSCSSTISNSSTSGTSLTDGVGSNGVCLENTGTLTMDQGFWVKGTNTTVTNSGTVNSLGGGDGVYLNSGTSVVSLLNSGAINVNYSGKGISLNSTASIGTLTNIGTISFLAGYGRGISNSGTITTLNNLQGGANGALNFYGNAPTNYNIIINSLTDFGQLSASMTGTTTFGIDSSSTLAVGTYSNVLTGVSSTSIANYSSIYNTWNNFNSQYKWELTGSGTTWGLQIALRATNITGVGVNYQSSDLGSTVNRVFDGGTLKAITAGNITGAFTITSNNGKIDQNGLSSNFQGVITDDSVGVHGKLIITNTGAASQGSVTLSGSNTYSGGTEVQAGATLSISDPASLGGGSLALVGSSTVPAVLNTTASMIINTPITVSGDPTFNVASGTTTTVSTAIADGLSPGDVVVDGGGTLLLTAANTYTGATLINNGSTLALSGAGSIAASTGTSINGTGVTNNGTFDITGKSANVALGGTYTQGSTGILTMNFSPTNNQQLNAVGVVTLGGSLSLTASSGIYRAGRYTLLTGSSISGTFASLNTNLGSYTLLAYSLSYDAMDVYLNLAPSVENTQSSLQLSANVLRGIYTLQTSAIANALTYDCNVFDKNGICVSAGGRYARVNTGDTNATNGLLIGSYRVNANARVGAWVDQNLSASSATGINLNNSQPMFGVFVIWNADKSGNGFEARFSAGYGDKDLTTTRQVVGSSEAGTGKTRLNTQGISAVASYNFPVASDLTLSPYLGARYTRVNANSYMEATSSVVTTPLTFSDLKQETTTALTGFKVAARMSPECVVFGSVGAELDTSNKGNNYSATGVTGLAAIALNPDVKRLRGVASVGAYYDLDKTQRVSLNAVYREEAFQKLNTLSTMATYTVGF